MQSRLCLCLVFLTLLPYSSFAQSSAQIDSMVRACNRYQKTDSIKISMLLNLSKAYTKSAPEKGLSAADEAIQLASQLNDSVALARGYFARSANLLQTGNFAEIIGLCNNGLAICIPRGLHLDIANLYNTLGGVYFYQGNYSSAREYFSKAYHSFQLAGDENGQTRTQINLGLISLKYRDFSSALQSFQTAVEILEKKDASPILAQAYDNIGGVYSETSDYDSALEYYEKALAIDRATNNKIGMAMRIANIAIVYNRTADYLKALEYYQQALKLNEELGNQRSYANTLTNIGTVYVQLEDYQKAGQYFRDALDLAESQGNQTLIAQNLMNLGNNHFMLEEIGQSEAYYRRALRIYEDAAYEPGIMDAYAKLANIYGTNLDYATALDYFNRALSRAETLDNKGIMADCLCSIGDIISVAPDSLLIRNNIRPEDRYAEAIRLEEKGLKILTESQILSRVLWCQNALSRTYEKAGDYVKAYEAFKQYFAIKDSLVGEETRKKFMRKAVEYEFEKKEALLRYEQQLTAEQLEKQKLFTRQQQQLLDLKEQALLLSNQEKDLHRLEYLKEKAEKQEKEQALYLAEKEKTYHSAELAVMAKEKALQLAALARKNALIGWLLTGVAALLMGGFALFFHQKQVQAKKEVLIQTNFTHLLLENTEAERGRIARDL
ncbi:MAG: tetratricopeptide repeat protein, partial [Saprospiraceae bacterium]|nr:tetratricopeptide repeat protein [Saprospiraceae bacterium]